MKIFLLVQLKKQRLAEATWDLKSKKKLRTLISHGNSIEIFYIWTSDFELWAILECLSSECLSSESEVLTLGTLTEQPNAFWFVKFYTVKWLEPKSPR